jgi:hypothetical protein
MIADKHFVRDAPLAGAKAQFSFNRTARLKSCPDTKHQTLTVGAFEEINLDKQGLKMAQDVVLGAEAKGKDGSAE